MTEKPSRLLATAKDLITNQNLNEAVVICEKVIQIDPNNINGLLLATKCWMDLDIKCDNVKQALEKILNLKPNNPTAIQGLRKFYEKNFELYFDDGIKFFRNLFSTNELIDKDFETIMKAMNQSFLSPETKAFICDCLTLRIETHKDIGSLKSLFRIAAEDLIIHKNGLYFDKFVELIAGFDSMTNMSSDRDELDYLKAMETLFKAFNDNMEPEFFYTILEKNNLTNIYGYTLFAEILCKHYLFNDCQDTIEIALSQLKSAEIFDKQSLYRLLQTLQIKNFVHWFEPDQLKHHWPDDAIDFIPKYLWCQAFSVGFDVFRACDIVWNDVCDEWCEGMTDHEAIISRAIMDQQCPMDLLQQHEQLTSNQAVCTSFQWYLWSECLKKSDLLDKQEQALEIGSSLGEVHFKIHGTLGEICSRRRNDYKSAVDQFWLALSKHFCPTILETLVDLHMSMEKYEQPIEILEKLEIENCSESLLNKFIMCLNYLERISDAISIAQRLAKQYPNNGNNWQLLGDLYLKRGNINSAFTTYSKSLELSGETSDILARFGNVCSMKYQQTLDENDFRQSVDFFDSSIGLQLSLEAVEGKTSVLYLHAEMSLRQLMLSSAVIDIQHIINILTDYHDRLCNLGFYLNLLGKTIFLAINGHIDNLIDFNRAALLLSIDSSGEQKIDSYDFAFKCFQASIRAFPAEPESYYNCALLGLHKLNSQCSSIQRGNDSFPDLYKSVEENFKTALHLDFNLHEAWKYLGYLYFRHGIISGRHAFDIQHCLSTAIDITSTTDSLKDPESAFLLGLLYIRENWCNLAKECFSKIEMDYSVNPIGHIGMYLLAAKDHRIAEQAHIAKAILCYNYRDEESNLDDICYRIDDSVVGLFCDNLGFMVNSSHCDGESFDSPESSSELISALKIALNKSWTKYQAYKAIGSSITPKWPNQYREYGYFLGILELLTGNQQWGKLIIEKSKFDCDNKIFSDLQKLDDSWTNRDHEQSLVHIKSLMTVLGLSINGNICEDSSKPTREIDRLLLVSIINYLSSSSLDLIVSLESLIEKLESMHHNENFTFGMQSSILMAVGALILTTRNQSLVNTFMATTDKYFSNFDDKMESFSRVLSRLKAISTNSKDAFKYLHNHCLKQPFDMNRWLNLLEFGLEHHAELVDFVDISQIFFITNRPWCFCPLDIERYAKILKHHSAILTTSAVIHQKHMIMRSVKLFPHLCFDLLFLFK